MLMLRNNNIHQCLLLNIQSTPTHSGCILYLSNKRQCSFLLSWSSSEDFIIRNIILFQSKDPVSKQHLTRTWRPSVVTAPEIVVSQSRTYSCSIQIHSPSPLAASPALSLTFYLLYREASGNKIWKSVSLYNRNDHRVFGLDPDTMYDFVVMSCGSNGECQVSNMVTLRTELSAYWQQLWWRTEDELLACRTRGYWQSVDIGLLKNSADHCYWCWMENQLWITNTSYCKASWTRCIQDSREMCVVWFPLMC